jgi:hypothetical protein
MCPSSSEPIRPIGPLAGDVYVERARLTERVERRRPRGEREGDDGHQREPGEDEADAEARERWFGGRSPLTAAGGYDDHGRSERDAAADDRTRTHVDKTA